MTILHEENGFELVSVDKNHAQGDWMSWIHHRCDGMSFHNEPPKSGFRWCETPRGVCNWCDTPIPKEIHGLWILHNWDRWQKRCSEWAQFAAERGLVR